MRLTDINESINDKGIFKAMFFAGLPGAGKTTIAQRVTDGTVSPRMVNTDRSYEFLLKKQGNESADPEMAWALLGPQSKVMNSAMLENYLNGMLPIFVDGTSANASSTMRRAGLAESLGYDTAMIWVNIDYDVAIERIRQRDRKVTDKFVRGVWDTLEGNRELYRSRFAANFIEVDNNSDNFSAMEGQVYNATTSFFTSPIESPIGNRNIDKIEEAGDKYLVPNIYDAEYIKKVVGVWYMK
jgi:predicted ABC-type ATPase